MYSVGSIADLISGSNTPNKHTVEVKQVKLKQKSHINPEESLKIKTKKKKSSNKINHEINEQPINILNNNKLSNAEKRMMLKRKPDSSPNPQQKKHKLENDENFISNKKTVKQTIFVGNVPLNTTEKEMKKFFSKYGEVKSLRFRNIPRADLKIPKKVAFFTKSFHPKRNSMNCYVVFKTDKDALNAKNADGAIFKDHHLRVDSLNKEQKHEPKKSIFVGNLPFNTEDEDLRKVFAMCGDISSVRIIRDSKTQMGKGFGYVNFDSSDCVELALQMEEIKIGNRVLRVSRCAVSENSKKQTSDGKKIRERYAIHINNLPRETTQNKIRELFKSCGQILSVRISKGADKTSFCYVNFDNVKAVKKATQLQNLKIGETSLKVNACKSKTEKAQKDENKVQDIKSKIAFLSKIPKGTTNEEIQKLLEDCGKIQSVRVIFNKKYNDKYGVAFVVFKKSKGLEQALKKENVTIGNVEIKISCKKEEKIEAEEEEDSDSEGEDLDIEEKKNWEPESDSSEDDE